MARLAIAAEERKKLYVLGGLLGAILVVVAVLYIPRGGSSTPTSTPSSSSGTPPVKNPSGAPGKPVTPGALGAPGATPGAPGAPGTPGGGASTPGGSGGGSGGISAASLVPVAAYRSDPFQQVSLPPPVPTPPPPPGPISIAPPDVILSPPGGSDSGGSLPPFGVQYDGRPSSTPASRILLELPPPRISRVADAPTAPSLVQLPGSEGQGGVSRSPGKRLAGVIIGDGVRAILVIDNGDAATGTGGTSTPPTTRIVQPGDEVEGIRILRIERVNEGGRTVTRMFVRENNEEHYIDLRAAPQQSGTGAGTPGGAPGGATGRSPF